MSGELAGSLNSMRQVGRRLGRRLAVAALLLLLAIAAFLTFRRIVGGVGQPVPAPVVCLTAAALAALFAAVQANIRANRAEVWWTAVGTVATAVGVGVFLTTPGTASGALIAFWVIVASENVISLRATLGSFAPPTGAIRPEERGNHSQQTSSETETQPEADSMALFQTQGSSQDAGRRCGSDGDCDEGIDEYLESAEDSEDGSLLPNGVLQQITQSQDDEGRVTFAGLLRARFAATERQTVLHVAFCPPLPQIPELSVYQLDGPESSIRVGELQVYGIRLEVKRSGPFEQAADVLIHFETSPTSDG